MGKPYVLVSEATGLISKALLCERLVIPIYIHDPLYMCRNVRTDHAHVTLIVESTG